MDALSLLRDIFPIAADRVSLELVELDVRDGIILAVVRLIAWDVDGETRQIRDVKEQEVALGRAASLEQPRAAACIEGWKQALEHLFAQDDVEEIEGLMPHELMPSFTELLALKRPRSADDFADALLGSRQRLGRWLKS